MKRVNERMKAYLNSKDSEIKLYENIISRVRESRSERKKKIESLKARGVFKLDC